MIVVNEMVAHWLPSSESCLDDTGSLVRKGVHDFAGSGAVSLLGATNALIGISMLGPRTGRFDGTRHLKGTTKRLIGHNWTLFYIMF